MYTYIKINGKHYITFEQPLDPTSTSLGSTWQDYLNGKIVLLSDEQVQFHEDHPEATVEQVWNMYIPEPPQPPERTLEIAKAERIALLETYDNSEEVNLFYVDENPMWLKKEERASLRLRFEAEQTAGITVTTLWYKDQSYTFKVENALLMLQAVELYASSCYDNTHQHMANINALETIEEVDSYDFTTGYPDKLHFVSSVIEEEE